MGRQGDKIRPVKTSRDILELEIEPAKIMNSESILRGLGYLVRIFLSLS
jgi:hypothetical protein